jgi:hypothetical protein
MVRDQADDILVHAQAAQIPCTIKRVKPSVSHRRRVSDVMQPSSSNQRAGLA